MKKLLFAIMLLCPPAASFAQSDDNPAAAMTAPAASGYKNEFGIDVSSLLRQFFNANQYYGVNNPPYYLTYRRHFKPGNIRFAIGGSYTNQDYPTTVPGNSNPTIFNQYYYQADFRLGWEFVTELASRWQVFYGLDVRPSFSHSRNEGGNYNNGYAQGIESKSTTVGLAPVLGFRYRITNRLSIMTEGAFSVYYQASSTRQFFTPASSQYPAIPDANPPKTKVTATNFIQPVSLIVAFDI